MTTHARPEDMTVPAYSNVEPITYGREPGVRAGHLASEMRDNWVHYCRAGAPDEVCAALWVAYVHAVGYDERESALWGQVSITEWAADPKAYRYGVPRNAAKRAEVEARAQAPYMAPPLSPTTVDSPTTVSQLTIPA